MLDDKGSAASLIPDGRDSRVEALLARLKERSEAPLRLMAERLVDLPEEQSFGKVEYDLRDLAHRVASSAHQAGLEASPKKAT